MKETTTSTMTVFGSRMEKKRHRHQSKEKVNRGRIKLISFHRPNSKSQLSKIKIRPQPQLKQISTIITTVSIDNYSSLSVKASVLTSKL